MGISKTKRFKSVLLIGGSISLLSFLAITIDLFHEYDPFNDFWKHINRENINKIPEIYDFPIKTFTAMIALITLISIIENSKLSEKQSHHNNYLNHFLFIKNNLLELNINNIEIYDFSLFYQTIFPLNNIDSFNQTKGMSEFFNIHFLAFDSQMNCMLSKYGIDEPTEIPDGKYIEISNEIRFHIEKLISHIGLKLNHENKIKHENILVESSFDIIECEHTLNLLYKHIMTISKGSYSPHYASARRAIHNIYSEKHKQIMKKYYNLDVEFNSSNKALSNIASCRQSSYGKPCG